MGLPLEMVDMLGELAPQTLVAVAQVQAPLITLLPDPRWWSCLFTALKEGDSKEIEALIAQAPMIVATACRVEPA